MDRRCGFGPVHGSTVARGRVSGKHDVREGGVTGWIPLAVEVDGPPIPVPGIGRIVGKDDVRKRRAYVCGGRAIIAVDVGNNTYSFGRYFETRGQRVLMSGSLGSIGFALPAAMGAWAATQDFEWLRGRKVISISGDGGLRQYVMELTTAVKYEMDITHVLLHNRELGKISKEQRAGEWPVWQTSLHNPSFTALAKSCGAHARRVGPADDMTTSIEEALAHEGPALVEIMTDPLQN